MLESELDNLAEPGRENEMGHEKGIDHDKELSSEEISKTLFNIWLRSESRVKRRSYRVPAKITALPCGCRRERSFEGDSNAGWQIKRAGDSYFHKECGRSVMEASPAESLS
jgi:hypothetical protein